MVFFRRLLCAVRDLHSLNISHEDLKRSNVLVDNHGCPILVDFGFSHFKANGDKVKSAGGTLDYCSPEKVEVSRGACGRFRLSVYQDGLYEPKASDVWALGILLTKMLKIPHPFVSADGEDDSKQVKQRIMLCHPYFEWPAEMEQDGLANLITGMLEHNPLERLTVSLLKPRKMRTRRYLLPDTGDLGASVSCHFSPGPEAVHADSIRAPGRSRTPAPSFRRSEPMLPGISERGPLPLRDAEKDRRAPQVPLSLLGEEMGGHAGRLDETGRNGLGRCVEGRREAEDQEW